MAAIASSARTQLHEILPHAQASMAWALARLACPDEPLFAAIAASAMRRLSGRVPELPSRNVGMLLWSFCQLGDLSLALSVLDASKMAGQYLDGLSMGGVVMAYQRKHMRHEQASLLQSHLSGGSSTVVASDVSAMLLAEAGSPADALTLLGASTKTDKIGPLSWKIWTACGGEGGIFQVVPPLPVSLDEPYAKELRVLQHVLTAATAGDVASVCAAVESFGSELLPGTSNWLKIAGGPKADVLAQAAQTSPQGGIVFEIGTYCGYSAACISRAREAARGRGRSGVEVVTVEVDAMHAMIARCLLAFAGLAHSVEVLTGHSEDVLPWAINLLHDMGGVDMLFLDQRGSRYESDLDFLERAGALNDGAIVVADNVLKPGAPLFLWQVTRGNYSTRILSLQEFAMAGVEDWMTVTTYHRLSEAFASVAPPPEELRILDWMAEQVRGRAHSPDFGGSGIDFAEWARLAAEMRSGMSKAGFVAEPAEEALSLQHITRDEKKNWCG